jgi:hypothetical protein
LDSSYDSGSNPEAKAMSNDAENPLIKKVLDKIDAQMAEIIRLKMWVNDADVLEGREPRFSDVTAAVVAGPGMTAGAAPQGKKWQPGDFFNKPFSAAVRNILLARAGAGGNPNPASVDEIHEALVQGSFNFGTSGAENQKNSIRISLGKNSAAFVRLPNSDLFGLVEWYGGRPKKAKKNSSGGSSSEETENEAEEPAAGDAVYAAVDPIPEDIEEVTK